MEKQITPEDVYKELLEIKKMLEELRQKIESEEIIVE